GQQSCCWNISSGFEFSHRMPVFHIEFLVHVEDRYPVFLLLLREGDQPGSWHYLAPLVEYFGIGFVQLFQSSLVGFHHLKLNRLSPDKFDSLFAFHWKEA